MHESDAVNGFAQGDAEQSDRGGPPIIGGGAGEQAGGFVDDDEITIAMDDVEG